MVQKYTGSKEIGETSEKQQKSDKDLEIFRKLYKENKVPFSSVLPSKYPIFNPIEGGEGGFYHQIITEVNNQHRSLTHLNSSNNSNFG
uniref:Uncharacterized protein n=1 Tax=Meloidogyne enterolobii TaxID=390850 RepID=A0A6V7U9R9_MELEN|nr:unnamed protein product [Meloidogyne enterolobii]